MLKYQQIENINTFLYDKKQTDIDELKWYKETTTWLPKHEADLIKNEQYKNMPLFIRNKDLYNSNNLQLSRTQKKFKFIPDWLYKIVPKFLGFMYITEYVVYTYEYVI